MQIIITLYQVCIQIIPTKRMRKLKLKNRINSVDEEFGEGFSVGNYEEKLA